MTAPSVINWPFFGLPRRGVSHRSLASSLHEQGNALEIALDQ